MKATAGCLVAVLLASVAVAQSWVQHDPRPILTARTAYDSHRNRAVMVLDTGAAVEVHEWDGSRWTPRSPGGPGPVSAASAVRALAFDPARRHTLLLTFGVPQAWAWNGVSWMSLPPPPFVPQWTSIAFDEVQQKLLVLDASAVQGVNRTWSFDGTQWLQLAANAPLPSETTMMAYDRLRSRAVLRSGNATFEWNGTAWVGGVTSVVPPSQVSIYHPLRGKVVVPTTTGTQWEWTGVTWVPFAAPAVALGLNVNWPTFCYDERRNELVANDSWTGTTQALGTVGWELRQRLPSVGGSLQLTADYAQGRVLAVETPAILNPNPPPTTMQWTPAGWQTLGNLGLPMRLGVAQADRDLGGVVYRFGGIPLLNGPATDELWAFQGTNWTLLSVPNAPAPRRDGGLAVDPIRQRLVSFGGRTGTTYWNDTREFDGTQWVPKYPATAPSPRHNHAMCGSLALGRVFLFGGAAAPTGAMVNDFWSFDGSNWNQLPAPSIGSVTWAALADYPAAGSVVLTVGAGSGQPNAWRWDGVAWSVLPNAPFATNLVATEPVLGSVYAPLAGALLVAAAAATNAIGSGCPGSIYEPQLRPFGAPWLGNASFAFDVVTPLPGTTPGLVAFGTQPAAIPVATGCTAWLVPEVSVLVLAVDGFGTASLPVPAVHALLGLSWRAQAAVLDAGVAHGFALSAAAVLTVGG